MRFMVLLRSPIPLAALHGDALRRAGVLLDAGDLVPDACGVSGYWLIDVRDREEAVQRVKRVGLPACVVEVRQVAVV